MADGSTTIELSGSELREVAGYAVACARPALAIFERERPDDRRPRAAIDAAQAFADGGERTKALRDSAWAAHRAAQEARDAGLAAASDAARAAGHAVGAAFLHPLANATQVKHILGSAAHAARALELSAGDGRSHRRSRPHRAVADPCASSRGGGPEALPGRPAWRWAGRRTDPAIGRVASVIPPPLRTLPEVGHVASAKPIMASPSKRPAMSVAQPKPTSRSGCRIGRFLEARYASSAAWRAHRDETPIGADLPACYFLRRFVASQTGLRTWGKDSRKRSGGTPFGRSQEDAKIC
jgi:Imm-5 like putative immunity protein